MPIEELWVQRRDLRQTKLVRREATPLAEGEVRVAIERFGLTANNVTYAITGDLIGYWKYYPAEDEWGKVPVWGFGDVVESRCAEVPVGERLWGFFPIATEVTLRPGKVAPERFVDGTPHRKPLPSLYNEYHRTGGDPPFLKALEDERCLLFPLFITSFILYDYLIDHGFFGAKQVLVGSASSKTGFGLAHLLHHDPGLDKRVAGLTSPTNVDFVHGLGVCDEVVAYADIAKLDPAVPTAFVDMAGSGAVIAAVHEHFREQIKESCIVGATHWEAPRNRGPLPGARPAMFFAPTHIAKREKDWGRGQVAQRAFAAAAEIAASVKPSLQVIRERSPQAVEQSWLAVLNNQVPPARGLMLTMQA